MTAPAETIAAARELFDRELAACGARVVALECWLHSDGRRAAYVLHLDGDWPSLVAMIDLPPGAAESFDSDAYVAALLSLHGPRGRHH